MIHEVKTWPAMFRAVASGAKTYEIRENDRPYAVGDVLHLREWSNVSGSYTGATCDVVVTFITAGGEWGIPADLCVMSICLCRVIHAPVPVR